jgi:N-acetylneuraminate synthase
MPVAERVFFIAEAGVNHNGSLELALKLVDAAVAAGADAVKFQTFKAPMLVTADAAKAEYQVANMKEGGAQLGMLQRLELSENDHYRLMAHCRDAGISFMSTAFDTQSLAFLSKFEMPAVKLASGDITCAPLLLQAARLRKPLIVSTGMSTLADIEDALGVIAFGLTSDAEPTGRADFRTAYCSARSRQALSRYVSLLHCVTQYPASPASVNLRAMDSMAACFGLTVGYSDHTLGLEVSLAAVARGARIIEKHFTLDRSLPGPDHVASLMPDELKHLVAGIRNIEVALGSTLKAPAATEAGHLLVARRSLVAARPLRRGEPITADALVCKRPGYGLSPMEFWDLLGRPAARDFAIDELIER